MSVALLQPSLLGLGRPEVDPSFAGVQRTELADGAWIERVPNWLDGEQTLFDELVETAPWETQRRPMYDRMVDVPRLVATVPVDRYDVVHRAAGVLAHRYTEPFDRVGLALYRDGADSVAPHGDQIARDLDTSVMATISLGAPRRFTLSPVRSGPAPVSFGLGTGDLLVMGGTIQRTWRHAVPKTNRAVGPRVCVMIRPPWLG